MPSALFLSTLPARGATGGGVGRFGQFSHHFYPRSPRGERRSPFPYAACWNRISIHAPREGSDAAQGVLPRPPAHFYPRSPRGERLDATEEDDLPFYFYPRSPRGERRSSARHIPGTGRFLSTLPARGATTQAPPMMTETDEFLSTLPARGATLHPLQGGQRGEYFYPRSPRGERPLPFNLRLIERSISIHAPREGSDVGTGGPDVRPQNFYPRSPRGERRAAATPLPRFMIDFYPRSPRGERPATFCARCWNCLDFYPRSPRGERLAAE